MRGGSGRGGSVAGRGRGGSFGGRGGFRGGRGGGRGGFSGGYGGPPASVVEVGQVTHACQNELVCKCTLQEQVPYFNGHIFLENKQEIGKIDEILGPIHQFMFSVKMSEGVKAESFKPETSLYIDANQVLPLSRFLPKPPIQKGAKKTGAGAGGARGARGGFSRGGSRPARGGGFSSRGGGFQRRGGRGSFRGGRGGY